MSDEGHAIALRYRQARVAALRDALAAIDLYKPLTLEIGCGHGHYLTAYAEQHPGEPCLGIDLITRRIQLAQQKAQKRALDRLVFLKGELSEFLEALPPKTRFRRIFMLFPDPWPKKRHHKNRMIQHANLGRLAEFATADARFYYRSDHRDYFEWTLAHLRENPHWQIVDEAWPFEAASYFQDLMSEWHSVVAKRAGEGGLARSAGTF